MKANRIEQHLIKKSNPIWKTVDEYCFRSKNMYNYANYIIRQEFINTSKEGKGNWIRYNELDKLCHDVDCYKELGSQAAQNILRVLDQNWKSFFVSIRDWKKNPSKYLGRPKLPKYKPKDGRQVFILKNVQCAIKDGMFRISFKPFKGYSVPTKIQGKLMQCRFIPNGNDYVMEIVYEIEVPECKTESHCIASIDLGIDNFATITNNIGLQPIVIKGGVIKSMNQYYNKKKSKLQSELMLKNKMFRSNAIQKLTNKRNNKVKDWIHKASKITIDYCLENNIDTLICGYNTRWKQESEMSKKVNQEFVGIPYNMYIKQLEYKSENVGIRFISNEESYTSGTSFLDDEQPIKENYNKKRRIYRGLFRSNTGKLINADVNGSYQIMKKVFPNTFSNGIEGAGLHPLIMKIS
ncbi:MAG: transposase [Bacilli bacterium]|nr:transposase [Bacilli bacterium]